MHAPADDCIRLTDCCWTILQLLRLMYRQTTCLRVHSHDHAALLAPASGLAANMSCSAAGCVSATVLTCCNKQHAQQGLPS